MLFLLESISEGIHAISFTIKSLPLVKRGIIFCKKTCNRLKKGHKLRALLNIGRFKENKYLLTVPRYKMDLLNKKRDVIIYEEAILLADVKNMLSAAKVECITDIAEKDNVYNEIHIGGPVSNEYVNRYVNYGMCEFKWVVTKEHLERYTQIDNLNDFNYDFIITHEDNKEGFLIGEKFYEYISGQIGWSIIVKFIDDVDRELPKTVHLLFGCGQNGTEGAVNYFTHQYIKIDSKNKSYMGIFKVDGKGVKISEIEWLDVNIILPKYCR